MPTVKVWNDNVHDHTEDFKGTKIVVPAKGFIEMEYEEAIDFKGQFSGVAKLDDTGAPDARMFKMIRVEQPKPGQVFKENGLVCHANGKQAATAEELRAMLAQFSGLLVNDPDAEKTVAAHKDEIADLKAQIAELASLVKVKRAYKTAKREA